MPQYFDSTAAKPMKTKRSVYRGGGAVKNNRGMGVALKSGGRIKAKGGKVGSKRKKMGPGAASPRRKKRGKFPDLTGDGKVTRADVLKGRGVFKSGGIAKRGRGCEIR